MKKKIIIICSIILAILAIFIYKVSAYFTTCVEAVGEARISVGNMCEIITNKNVQFNNKNNQIITLNCENIGDGRGGIRLKILCPSTLNIDYILGDNWILNDDGYIYYNEPLEAEEKTTDLKLKLNASNIEKGTNFKIITISESTEVYFDEDGYKFDWSSSIKELEEIGEDE